MRPLALWAAAAVLFLSGCAAFRQQEPTQQTDQVQANQTYYGFTDVSVPQELELVRDRTFVYEAGTLKAGVLVFKGNVELSSLESYFKANMARSGWRLINTFRYKDVALNFAKEDRTCNIKMSRSSFTTEVEIWVGPTGKETGPKTDGQR